MGIFGMQTLELMWKPENLSFLTHAASTLIMSVSQTLLSESISCEAYCSCFCLFR